jgi:spermidine synthase
MRSILAGLCLLLSGFAGLVYEIVWIRQASLVFGSTTQAVSTVVAVFFAGLALGSWLAGRRHSERPMRLYAMLEIALALVAMASPVLFGLADSVFGAVYGGVSSATLALLRIALVGVILLPPATLMGATLPLFCRQLVVDARRIGVSVALLYALNTLGAAVGCLAAGLWLLPSLGMSGSIRTAAVGNVLAAAIAWRVAWEPIEPAALPVAREPADKARWLPSALFFLAGFAIVGDEVLWTRYLALLVHHDVYTYTITLGTILTGIVVGSVLAARASDRDGSLHGIFGALQIGVGLYVMGLTSAPPEFWRGMGDGWLVHLALLLPPSVASGASFPLAVRMVVRNTSEAASGVGRMAALNTVGGIAGSLLAGFVLLPGLGLQRSLHLMTAVSVLTGLMAWLIPARDRRLVWSTAIGGVLALAWAITPALAGTRIPQDFLAARGALIDFREGRAANVAVVNVPGGRELTIDRLWQGQDRKNHQIMAAHLPLLLHPAPSDVLVVGVGAGLAPSRMLMHPLQRLECVDIEPAVFELIEKHFESAWMRDPRVHLIAEDGQNHVRHGERRYDVISVEVGQTMRPGVGGFYTVDFYRRARARLKPNGIVSQFVPLLYFPKMAFRRALQSFRQVFPTAVLWYNKTELLLVGFDAERVPPLQLERLAESALSADLAYAHWGGPAEYLNRPETLAAGLLMGPKAIADLAGGVAPFVDDRPELDYLASDLAGGQVDEREVVAEITPRLAGPALVGVTPTGAAATQFARMREGNIRDLLAAGLVRRVELDAQPLATSRVKLEEAVSIHPDNVEAHDLLGEVSLRGGDLKSAEIHFRWALRIEPGDVQAARGLAFTLHRLGQTDEAVLLYRKVLVERPGDAVIHNNLGVALAGRGEVGVARRHFAKALSLLPDYAEAARNLALTETTPH